MTPASNSLFIVRVKVRRGAGCDMPVHLVGALVDCFVAAPDHLSALKLAVEELRKRRYVFEDLADGKVVQLDPQAWDRFVQTTWPEFPEYFPPQADMPRFIRAGGVFFGPFVAWERE